MEPVSFGTFTRPTIRSQGQYSHSPPLDTPGLIQHHTSMPKSESRRRRSHDASFSVPTAPLRAKEGIPSPEFGKSYMCLARNRRSNPQASRFALQGLQTKTHCIIRINLSLGNYRAELMLSIALRAPTHLVLIAIQLLMGSVIHALFPEEYTYSQRPVYPV